MPGGSDCTLRASAGEPPVVLHLRPGRHPSLENRSGLALASRSTLRASQLPAGFTFAFARYSDGGGGDELFGPTAGRPSTSAANQHAWIMPRTLGDFQSQAQPAGLQPAV